MLIDYHVHTPYCGHAHGQTIQYIQTAIQKGIAEICFTDHLGRYYLTKFQKRRYWDWGMSEQDLPRYYSELSDLREIFGNQISIKIGLEIDYIEGAEELLLPIIEEYPLDFRIGSIHCIPHFGWKHLSEFQDKATEPVLLEYFRLVQSALSSKLFHSIAHIDFIWRDTQTFTSNSDLICDQIYKTVKTAVENKTCVEINANGFLWAQAQHTLPINPFDYFIDQIKRLDALITIGSDAHEPYYVGKSLSPIIQMLLSKGINRVCRFSEGEMYEESLE